MNMIYGLAFKTSKPYFVGNSIQVKITMRKWFKELIEFSMFLLNFIKFILSGE